MYARRRRTYFALMGTCLALFVSAWSFVRLWSTEAAVGMAFAAMVLPPLAAIAANRRDPDDHWWDEPPPPSRPTADHPHGADLPDPHRPDPHRPDPDRADPGGDPESDAWWAELDGRSRPEP
ncbi:DUF3099 domain-containing protein [Streptomyces sp. DH12]|uniref:DUF3099 domain-containing protein n=1 Tax=Streptomyces sp. DH12 TaxID=2857010 RepID=UPI001E4F40E9|nr:DUF3099 domain-containing protein [Streptomyces sp. DH12]